MEKRWAAVELKIAEDSRMVAKRVCGISTRLLTSLEVYLFFLGNAS